MANVPWFWPGVLISGIAGFLVPVLLSRFLAVRPVIAGVLILALGIILSATLTPLRDALEYGATGTGACDFSRLGLAPPAEIRRLNDTSLNILLFVPLGVVIGLLSRSWTMVIAVLAAVMLPIAIEAIQMLVPALARGCQSADVADNLTGLAIGWGGGSVERLFRSGRGSKSN